MVRWLLSRSKHKLREKDPENLTQWALILRLAPGVPFIFTNYILGILKMPFRSYLLISLPILSLTSCGYVLIFAGVFGGEKVEESAERWAYALGGVGLVVAMTLLGRIISRKRLMQTDLFEQHEDRSEVWQVSDLTRKSKDFCIRSFPYFGSGVRFPT